MLIFYNTGGSQQIILEQQMPPQYWDTIERTAIRFLRQRGESQSADILQDNAFEMWEGSNKFGDQFELLYLRTSLSNYLEFEKKAEGRNSPLGYCGHQIASALEALNKPIRFIAIDIDTDDVEAAVPAPELKITSEVVERALGDFEALAHSSGGAVSGVDRLHTALHGYFETVCEAANITYKPESPTTTLFSLIRQHHPALQKKPPGIEADKVLRAMAQIVDVLNPMRNQKSMAHPNEDLLEDPEAMLIVNAVRTLLHYLNDKLQG